MDRLYLHPAFHLSPAFLLETFLFDIAHRLQYPVTLTITGISNFRNAANSNPLRAVFRLCTQCTLGDILVASPVIKVCDPHTADQYTTAPADPYSLELAIGLNII